MASEEKEQLKPDDHEDNVGFDNLPPEIEKLKLDVDNVTVDTTSQSTTRNNLIPDESHFINRTSDYDETNDDNVTNLSDTKNLPVSDSKYDNHVEDTVEHFFEAKANFDNVGSDGKMTTVADVDVCSESSDVGTRNSEQGGDSSSVDEHGSNTVRDNAEQTVDVDEEADGSGSSDTEGEYESADEGEEIQVDAEQLKNLEESLTDEEKEERRQSAQMLKVEGNELFRCGSYKSAIKVYSRALRTCPLKYAKDRSIMYSNRAVCKLKLNDNESAIRDCTKAVDLHPHYMKALMRRAELYEKTEKLEEALADFQKIIELDPSQHSARAACMRLPDQIKEKNEKLKEEMMGKLKELGNLVLRPFGLSTSNFQLNQDPNTGGYSVNFVQNPAQDTEHT